MARYAGDAGTAGSSALISGGELQLLQARAGKSAIAKNDLVVQAGLPPRLYPVKFSDYAAVSEGGASVVALTSVQADVNAGATNVLRSRAVVDSATGDIFYADVTGSATPNSNGCTIWKYNAQGAYLKSVQLENVGVSSGTNNIQTMFLSNGNILVFWWSPGVAVGLSFAIVDKRLSIVVPQTPLFSSGAVNAGTNPGAYAHCIALSGGGFAVAWGSIAGAAIAIRSNTGAIVLAATSVSGTAANNSGNSSGMNFRLAQLSDGNIFIGIHDTFARGLRYAIYSPTGAVVKAFTVIANSKGNNESPDYPEIGVIPGYACIANVRGYAFVINNAGVIQGTPLEMESFNEFVRIVGDATNFWVFASASSAALTVTRLPISGAANKVQTTVQNAGPLTGDVFIEDEGFVVFNNVSNCILAKDPDGTVSIVEKSAFVASGMAQTIKLADFCAMAIAKGKFQITKYRAASIFGIAQADNPANNDGVLLPVASGVGGGGINPIQGSNGKAYDHRSASVAGTSGAMYSDAVTFKGIA